MELALLIAGVWALAAAVVALALWKDRERAPEQPLREPLPTKARANAGPPRRRAAADQPTYPAARR